MSDQILVRQDSSCKGEKLLQVRMPDGFWSLDFDLIDLFDDQIAVEWILKHFHPDGLKCPRCQAGFEEATRERTRPRSRLVVYKCKRCRRPYNLYSGTVLARRHARPIQVFLIARAVLKGIPSRQIMRELGLSDGTVTTLRRKLQGVVDEIQHQKPLSR